MTIIDAPTTTRPALVPVTFDLYRDIHKAIRSELFDLVLAAGRTDPGDAGATAALATHVARVGELLDQHAEHEDRHIQPAILQVAPGEADRIEADHADFEGDAATLVARAVEVTEAPTERRRQLGHWLYVDLAELVSRYLAHQDLEERVVMPALEAALGLDAVLGVHEQIITTMPPEELMRSLAVMLPAMNLDDCTELLGGMQASAPPEAFAGVWELAGSVLCPGDVARLAGRLGLA